MLRLGLRLARPFYVQLDGYRAWCATSQSLQFPRTFTTTRPRPDDKSDEQVTIRWYEQLNLWSPKRRVDPNNLFGEHDEEIKQVRAEIEQLDAELREMENPSEGRTFVEPLLVGLSEEDQKRIREEIRQNELEEGWKAEEKALLKAELQKRLPQQGELEIRWELPKEQRAYLQTLNENIYNASSNLQDHDLRKKLWQSYIRCKAFLPPFLHLIPEMAWLILCASQQTLSPDDPHWAPHMVTLVEDMLKVGRELHVYQRFLYIEALRQMDRQEVAISQWEELKNHLGEDKQASEEYELLGVRLFASHGDPERAEKIARSFLGRGKQEESRILIPILTSWTLRRDDIGMKRAWALYLQFKTQVGSNITMEDYDNVTLSFLNVGRTDLALAAFRDMMLTGQETEEGSVELYVKSLGFMDRIVPGSINVDDLNKIALTGMTILPKRFQNKFFFGKWLKKLLGMGQTDAAASVIELMYERGIRPDAKHLNGIIGSWLRSGIDRDQKAAEKMAWAMIHERLDFVNKRRNRDTVDLETIASVPGLQIPAHLRRTVAPATIETFALLLQHYARRSQEENIRLINYCLSIAEIKPNTHYINHFLYLDLRHGQHQAAFARYQKEFGRHLKPDLETFACLWDCEKAHLESLIIHRNDKFPNSRKIFLDMMSWFSELTDRPGEREHAQAQFSKELYDQIIRCMCQSTDLEATIVALYALKETFGIYPDKETARMVSLQVARLGAGEKERVARRKRHARNPHRAANVDKITQIFAIIAEQRNKALAELGVGDLGECNDDVRKEEGLFILAEFLRVILRRSAVEEDEVEKNIEKTAWEMGVSGIDMGDPLNSYVVEY